MAKLDVGRVYIKWFSFRCRSQVRTYACHRCVGFDHKVGECRQKANASRQCGQIGHTAAKCQNPVDCRNCRHRGQPSGHHINKTKSSSYGSPATSESKATKMPIQQRKKRPTLHY
ncbi:hypothetical protein KR200_006617 [Drosophila serrata]|nr:hypothetical protein KR200_006617 [Drosophila serrata]